MRSDIKHWVHSCLAHQLSKVHRHTLSPLSTFSSPTAHFDNIHLDIVGPQDTKVQKLRKELKALKKTLINKDTVISNLQGDIETIRRKSEKSIARLIKQYNLAVSDFAKLDAELADQTSDEAFMLVYLSTTGKHAVRR